MPRDRFKDLAQRQPVRPLKRRREPHNRHAYPPFLIKDRLDRLVRRRVIERVRRSGGGVSVSDFAGRNLVEFGRRRVDARVEVGEDGDVRFGGGVVGLGR